jgi:superfamily II DNA or RNA helicase
MYKVQLLLNNQYKIKIKTNSSEYIKTMKDEFAFHAKNYFWSGKFKAGMWDGKIHFITEACFMPFGLLLDFLRKHKELFPDIPIEPDIGVKNLFKGVPIEPNYNLSLYPRPYQKETIESTLKYSKGIIRSATASGKSLAISYIIKSLLDNRSLTKVGRSLIIVPSTQLVEQFKNDMIEYGINEKFIGKVYTGFKEWDKAIVVSTWQTLKNNSERMAMYDCVIGDECHSNKAPELKKLFSKSKARYRLGFTGTLPNHITELLSVKSFLGPVIKEYPSGLLAEQGYIAKCKVKAISISYPMGIEANTYHTIKEETFHSRYRLKIISKIVNGLDDNILLLVTQIAEGDKLVKLLNRKTKREVVFLSGKDKTEKREEWRQKMMKQKNIALIATYGIFQQGINIPNLKYAMLASPTKSKIRTLQSVGRTLRAHDDKDYAVIFDMIDEVKFLSKHGSKRLDFYKTEGFEIENIDYNSFIQEI